MAKSKNHTNHNQHHKDHRNGIKKPRRQRQTPKRGMDVKFLRNLRFIKKHQEKQRKEKPQSRSRKQFFSSTVHSCFKYYLFSLSQQFLLLQRSKKRQQKKDKRERPVNAGIYFLGE